MLSDQTTAHLCLFSSVSPLALLASFTCSFFKCFPFFPLFGPPITLFLPTALEGQCLPHELWISKRLYPGILPTPRQLTASSEPSSVLLMWSSHTKVKLKLLTLYMEPFQRSMVHPMAWLDLCNLLMSSRRPLMEKSDIFPLSNGTKLLPKTPHWGFLWHSHLDCTLSGKVVICDNTFKYCDI